MNVDQPKQAGANQTPQDLQNHEPALIDLYSKVTGENESHARSTLMYVIRDSAASNPLPND